MSNQTLEHCEECGEPAMRECQDCGKSKRISITSLDIKVLAVAVEGSIGDWAAYIGAIPGFDHDSEWQAVYKHGSKLPENLAKILFPEFHDLEWRD